VATPGAISLKKVSTRNGFLELDGGFQADFVIQEAPMTGMAPGPTTVRAYHGGGATAAGRSHGTAWDRLIPRIRRFHQVPGEVPVKMVMINPPD